MKLIFNKSILAGCLVITATHSIKSQAIACGGWHSLAICADSTVKAFGENASGQLGDGTTSDKSSPVTVAGLNGVIAVSGGGDQLEAHSMALKANGTVWSWGSNLYGALGNGSTNNSNSPVQAIGLTGVTAISAGGWHSSALKNDGTVWVWGWNTDGQLGDNTLVDKAVPTMVTGLSGIVRIAAGTYHMLALKNDGTVWAWGDNVSGQIGNNTLVDQKTPIQVSGLSNIVAIAAGRFFSLAVRNDGTVWTWGENLYGQLGNGTMTDSKTPVQVSGLTGITSAVAATGAFHCMAIKNDNTVWAWGRNTYGNLGDGTLNHQSSPVQMSGVSNMTGLAAGTNFSLLYKNDQTLWGCGRNASGQLGDGTVLQRNTIVQSTALCSMLTPVGLKDQTAGEIINAQVFPNPSADGKYTLSVERSSGAAITTAGVFNATGAKVLEVKLSVGNSALVDLSDQASGLYYLSIYTEEGNAVFKLIRQ